MTGANLGNGGFDQAEVPNTPTAPGLFLALAPMDGITDWVYRALLTEMYGGASGISLCVSEFVRVTGPVPARVLIRDVPELGWGGRTRAGVPVAVQLLGSAPAAMAQTAARAVELGAPAIDLNFGCPAKTVNHHDGGATLLRAPNRLQTIVAAVVDAVAGRVPVSAKIRLGWDCSRDVAAIAQAAQAGGAAWLTIHARTRLQGYAPPVDWHGIGRARQAVEIPVVANGDIDSIAAAAACAAASGCAALMIGRAAMGDPLIFRRLRGLAPPEFDGPWLFEVLQDYAGRLQRAGSSASATLGRLKQWLRLAAPMHAEFAGAFDQVKRLSQLDAAWPVLAATLCEGEARRSASVAAHGSMRHCSPSSTAAPLRP